jgi:hypothetical protein
MKLLLKKSGLKLMKKYRDLSQQKTKKNQSTLCKKKRSTKYKIYQNILV